MIIEKAHIFFKNYTHCIAQNCKMFFCCNVDFKRCFMRRFIPTWKCTTSISWLKEKQNIKMQHRLPYTYDYLLQIVLWQDILFLHCRHICSNTNPSYYFQERHQVNLFLMIKVSHRPVSSLLGLLSMAQTRLEPVTFLLRV
jgi:hypothetical protein